MENVVQETLLKGVNAHRSGQFDLAKQLYASVIQVEPRHADANHNTGVIEMDAGNIAQAIPFLRIALEENSDNGQHWVSYIDALIRVGAIDDAQSMLTQAKQRGAQGEAFDTLEKKIHEGSGLSIDSVTSIPPVSDIQDPPHDKLQYVLSFYNQGQMQRALDEASKLLNQYPNAFILHNVCGITNADLGQYDAAIESYTRALTINPNDAQVHFNMGVLLDDTGDLKGAIESYNKALIAKADYADAYVNKGMTLNCDGDQEGALESFNQAIKVQPGRADAHYNMGNLLRNKGELDAALESLRQVIKINPDHAEAYNSIGAVLRDSKNLETAIDSFKQALTIKPNYAEAHYNMGLVLQDKGDLEAAIDSYEKAIKIKPDYVEIYNDMGNLLKKQGKLESAIINYKKAINLIPNFLAAYMNMGIVQQEQGNLEAAIESYKKVLKITPDYMEAYINMGNSLKDRGEFQAAINNYKQALKVKPDHAETYNNMGIVQQFKGDLEAAIDSYEKAIKIKPDYVEAFYNLGVALQFKGEIDDAVSSYKKALSIKPDYFQAQVNIGHALREKGEDLQAQDSYIEALNLNPDAAEVHRNLSDLKKFSSNDEQIDKMKVLHQKKDVSHNDRCHLSFALAKAYTDLNQFEVSFKYLNEGNALRKEFFGYDISQDIKLFNTLKGTQPFLERSAFINIEVSDKITPIFIVGMPRSGTTLVEQIISSHSMVTGAGELSYISALGGAIAKNSSEINKKSILRFRQSYLNALKKRSDNKSFVTDKMPQNFMYVALILSAFPEAKIIHTKRDPAATCWSNYQHYFSSERLGHCYDLSDIVEYYGLYQSLMQFWRQKYGRRIYNLDYDKLTIKQEGETRKLLNYIGLAWDNECLFPQNNKRAVSTASQQQIRKKVYQGSSQKWRKFEPFLDGAFDQL